jgi:sugar phosphate isomerase/epimerase
LQETGIARTIALLREAGLSVSSLCRAGFLTDPDDDRHADNVRAIEEAAALQADCLVMVVGGLPDRGVAAGGMPDRGVAGGGRGAGQPDLAAARALVADRLDALVPVAQRHGVRLALEPLHPMYCADRAVLSTLAQANDLAERYPAETVGVVVDTFHTWWDPDLRAQVRRAADRILSYQLAEWILPLPADPLLARGMIGDGYVDFATITRWVAETGYSGAVEVEIFNADLWAADPREVLDTTLRRYVQHVQPHLTPLDDAEEVSNAVGSALGPTRT